MSTSHEDEPQFIALDEKDNTVTALRDLKEGEKIASGPGGEDVVLLQDIAYGHKFARAFIARGADVVKYGQCIGVATADIQAGEHVHVHNVESKRARAEGGGQA